MPPNVCLKQSSGWGVPQSKPKHHTWFGLGHPKHHHSHAGGAPQAPLEVGTGPPQAPLSRAPSQNRAAPAAGCPNLPLFFFFLFFPSFFFFFFLPPFFPFCHGATNRTSNHQPCCSTLKVTNVQTTTESLTEIWAAGQLNNTKYEMQ